MIKKITFFFSLYLLAASKKYEVPSYIERCKVSDPKVSECLLKASEFLRPYLVKGIPELGIPSIETLVIPELSLAQDTQALNFSATLKDVKTKGLPSYKFSKFDFDVSNLQWFTSMTMGKIDLEGEYTVSGTILGSPIKGKGKFTAGIDSGTIDANMKSETYTKKGETYLRPVNTTVSFTAQGPRVHLDGLFDGDQDSSKLINNIIKDNINDLFQEIKPLSEKLLANLSEQFLYRYLMRNIPYNKLYIVQ